LNQVPWYFNFNTFHKYLLLALAILFTGQACITLCTKVLYLIHKS
jgi:hypothetical protein